MLIKFFTGLFFCLLFSNIIAQQHTDYNYSEEKNIYAQVSNVDIITSTGRSKLSDIYTQTPVIIAFIYTRCTGICSPFLTELSQDISISSKEAKQNFKVLVVSFDTADKIEDMQKLAARYRLENNNHWIFAITPQVDLLCKSVSFYPVWDSIRKQFDHEALLNGINKDGFIVKRLTGISTTNKIQTLIKQLNGAFVASYQLPRNNSLFSCFTYNPSTGEKRISLGLILLIAPFILSLLIVFLIAQIANNQIKNKV